MKFTLNKSFFRNFQINKDISFKEMNNFLAFYNEQLVPRFSLFLSFLSPYYKDFKRQLSLLPFFSSEPLDLLILYTFFLLILFKVFFPLIQSIASFSFASSKANFLRFLMRKIPYFRIKMEKERLETEQQVFLEISQYDSNQTYKIPKNGIKLTTLQDRLNFWLKRDETGINTGKVSGDKYHNDHDYERNLKEFIKEFFLHNPLHFDVYTGARQMEAEVLSMTGYLLNCDKDHVFGATTSGGTESNMMAIYTYREWARETKFITKPEIIMPTTAHASFYKAAHFYNVKVVALPINDKTGTVEVSKIRKAISGNTICIIGSMPNYPHGTCDPIEEIAALALKNKVGFHVDACLGGFLTLFAKENKVNIPKFDFTVKGVTSISIDHHKYGLANKGISSIFYKTKELRHYQYFANTSWVGGIYATPTAPGSRSGAPIAGAWFAMVYNGLNVYKENAKKIFNSTRVFREKIENIKELKVIGNPLVCVVAFASRDKGLNIYAVHEILKGKGWKLGALNTPPCIHLTITLANEPFLEGLVKEIIEAIEMIRKNPEKFKGGIMGTIYGTTQHVPNTQIADEFMKVVLDASLKI